MKKPLVLFFITIISLCMAGTAISLAWFDGSNFLMISSFDFSVTTADDLKISKTTDADSFTDSLDESGSFVGNYLVPVSSMMSDKWLLEDSDYPVFYGQNNRNANQLVENNEVVYVEPEPVATDIGYFTQELYLKSESPHMAYLDTSLSNSFVIADENKNAQRAEKLLEGSSQTAKNELINKLNNLENSMRVSIFVDSPEGKDYKIFDPHKNDETLFGGPIDSDCKGMYDVKVGTDVNYEVLYGEVKNRDKIVYSYNQTLQRKNNPTWSDSGHYNNTNTIDLNASLNNGVEIAKEPSISFEDNANNIDNLQNSQSYDLSKMLLIPLSANVPTRIVISIYMEGWDIDNVDATMGGSFTSKLQFGILDRYII